MLNFIAGAFAAALRRSTPWLELRRLLDDQVPATATKERQGKERERGVRSDLLESIILVVCALLARMDIRSLRVGHHVKRTGPKKPDFVGLPMHRLIEWTGLSEETIWRVLRLLRHAGLVHGPGWDGVNIIAQPCEKQPDGTYDHHPAIRRFDELFFLGLGFGPWLQRERAERARPPAPFARPAVHPKSGQQLVEQLARLASLERPPDG